MNYYKYLCIKKKKLYTCQYLNLRKVGSDSKSVGFARKMAVANKAIFSRKRIRFFAILFLLMSLFFYVYIYYSSNKNILLKFNILNNRYLAQQLSFNTNENAWTTLDSVTTSNGECNPIRKDNKLQHKVMIDGIEYPQYTPIHFDKHYDFECLNKNSANKSLKKILFWNKFYGDDSFYYKLGI